MPRVLPVPDPQLSRLEAAFQPRGKLQCFPKPVRHGRRGSEHRALFVLMVFVYAPYISHPDLISRVKSIVRLLKEGGLG